MRQLWQYGNEAWPIQCSNYTPLPPLPPASEVKTNTISMKQQHNHKKPEFLICTKRNISNIATYQPQPQLLTCVLSSELQLLDPQTWSFISRDASGQMKCCHQGVVFLMPTCIQLHGEEAAKGGLCKTKDGRRSQFHSTISPPADKATMTVETRACHPAPRGRPPPLQILTKQTFQTFSSCHSKPFQEKRNTLILALNHSKSALLDGQFLPFRSFVILDLPRATFHGLQELWCWGHKWLAPSLFFTAPVFVCWPLLWNFPLYTFHFPICFSAGWRWAEVAKSVKIGGKGTLRWPTPSLLGHLPLERVCC